MNPDPLKEERPLPVQYRVSHTTVYEYTEPVSTCHNIVHLGLRRTPWQMPGAWEVIVSPKPDGLTSHRDYFGNDASCFAIEEPHDRMVVTLAGEVEVQPRSLPQRSRPWEALRSALPECRTQADLEAFEFTFASPLIEPFDALAELTDDLFTPKRPYLEAVWDLTERINRTFAYDPEATDIATPLHEVLANRHGVCQDFAHLQIACLRRLGLPARYISGYLRTGRDRSDDDAPMLLGADASHAWISVYCPDSGWWDFDPTNRCIGGEQHVTAAWGRDYSDVSPIRGVLLGSAGHTVKVAVEVRPLAVMDR
ncbi:MAG: transglutaminase family protein [Phycisphaeraceae bacterium]|nr:transglutaminase family protein [Phycisphaeraceae bacterium]